MHNLEYLYNKEVCDSYSSTSIIRVVNEGFTMDSTCNSDRDNTRCRKNSGGESSWKAVISKPRRETKVTLRCILVRGE